MNKEITITENNNTLKVKFTSRLDKSNAEIVLIKIRSKITSNINKIEIDASDLRYIYSDGIDILIELKKQIKDIVINNAGVGICDIFESYGLSDSFVKLDKSYRFLSIKDSEMIGHGGHGAMYKVGEDTIVKVYIDNSPFEVIENERKFARNAFINGIPTAIAYDIVETEKGYGVVFEMLGGMTLSKFMNNNPDKFEEYGNKFADLLYQLNNTEADPDLFVDFKQVFLDRADNAVKLGLLSTKDAEGVKRIISAIPTGTCMIHGDFHPNNVMVDENGDLMLIDMADIARGNGFFDIGSTYLVLKYVADTFYTRQESPKISGLYYKDSIRLWNILLKRYYHTDDEKLLEIYNARCKAFSDIRIATSLGMKSSRAKFLANLMRLYTKYIILPKADKYIALFTDK